MGNGKDSYILGGSSMILSKMNGNATRQDNLDEQGSALMKISAYRTNFVFGFYRDSSATAGSDSLEILEE